MGLNSPAEPEETNFETNNKIALPPMSRKESVMNVFKLYNRLFYFKFNAEKSNNNLQKYKKQGFYEKMRNSILISNNRFT
jgi:hypothetical protein